MDQVKFVEDSHQHNLLGPFLNTLTQISVRLVMPANFYSRDAFSSVFI